MLREDLRTVRGSALILTLAMRKRCPHNGLFTVEGVARQN
jgi:hypothetical protein